MTVDDRKVAVTEDENAWTRRAQFEVATRLRCSSSVALPRMLTPVLAPHSWLPPTTQSDSPSITSAVPAMPCPLHPLCEMPPPKVHLSRTARPDPWSWSAVPPTPPRTSHLE
eukprot:CAMPEP_0202849588 /NCGR_PEP_ID=MMETSP1389-20130828/81177_1 /ASSEMBLY_ACC=CAM_ASM_000865 /TAXON_ID=302021 /ORGANISM="Rhodomonas sp., Strain CCMP768" /LENGTH=111 /DNA_ID=CAMNT_0049527623 /DNA_START=46 /DNA_END=378 /DNA_ORIENTATION=-